MTLARCNRGHETSRLLWNCPACTDGILTAARRAYYAVHGEGEPDDIARWLTAQLRLLKKISEDRCVLAPFALPEALTDESCECPVHQARRSLLTAPGSPDKV